MPASFNDLPSTVHARIIAYVCTPPGFPLSFFSYLPSGSLKQDYRKELKPYETLNRAWSHFIQAKLWNNLCITPSEINQLRQLFTTNPALATHVRSIKLRSPVRLPSDPRRPTNPAPLHDASIPFDEAAGDTKEGLRIAWVWSEALNLIRDHVLPYGQLERLGVDVRLGVGKENRLVKFPTGYTVLPGQGGIRELELVLPKAKRGDRLDMESVGRMVESVGGELKALEFRVMEGDIGERGMRREIYVGLTNLTAHLKSYFAPNLTSLNLSYLTFRPCNDSETRIYPYIHADDGVDILSCTLRLLSKQLISFTYIGGRISSELFHPTYNTTENPTWPHLKHYTVHFSPITATGEWLFAFPDSSSPSYTPGDLRPRTPPSPPSDDEMIPTDPTYEDPLADEYDYDAPRRYLPIPALVDKLFETASHVMVPNMPVVEHWELGPQGVSGEGVGMGLRFDYEEGTKRPRITRGRAYEHSKSTMGAWEARFGAVQTGRKRKREDTVGLMLVKVENAGVCGVSCMDEEDQRAWRGEESESESDEGEQ